MVKDAVTTKAGSVEDISEALQDLKIDSSATWQNDLTAALHDLRITDKCHGSDMVIKMVNYFSNDLFGKMELEAPLA